jgi:hypothetical protein
VTTRRRWSWLVALGLAMVGSVAAHSLGLLSRAAEEHQRSGEQTAAAHELAGQVPLVAGLVMAVVVVGLACRVWRLARRQSPGPLPPWGFAAVPLLGWVWQETAERVLGVESFPFSAAWEPAFLKGLGVQVLFGIVAVLVAWRLLAFVGDLRRHHQAGWCPQPAREGARVRPIDRVVVRPRQLALVRGYDERGPPPRR